MGNNTINNQTIHDWIKLNISYNPSYGLLTTYSILIVLYKWDSPPSFSSWFSDVPSTFNSRYIRYIQISPVTQSKPADRDNIFVACIAKLSNSGVQVVWVASELTCFIMFHQIVTAFIEHRKACVSHLQALRLGNMAHLQDRTQGHPFDAFTYWLVKPNNTFFALGDSKVVGTPTFHTIHTAGEAHLWHVARFQRGQTDALHQLFRLGRILPFHPHRALGAHRWRHHQASAGAHGWGRVEGVWAQGPRGHEDLANWPTKTGLPPIPVGSLLRI